MSWTRVQGAGAENTVGTTGVTSLSATFGSSVTAGNLLTLGLATDPAGGTVTVQDSVNSTNWTLITTVGGGLKAAVYWFVPPVGGSMTVTITFGTPNFPGIAIEEWSFTPGATVTVDASATGAGTGTSHGVTSPGTTLTPTGTDLIYCVSSVGANGAYTPGSGFTAGITGTFAASKAENCLTEYVLNQTSVITPAATFTASTIWEFAAVAFKAAIPPPPTPVLTTNPHITKNGMLGFVATNPAGTAVSNITSVSGAPTVFVDSVQVSSGDLYGPIWTDNEKDTPFVFWDIQGQTITSSNVVMYTMPANCINTGLGGNLVVTSAATVPNSAGSLEPVFGQVTAWAVPTTIKAACNLDDGPWVNTQPQPHAANLALRMNWVATAGVTITQNMADNTLVDSWTGTNGILASIGNYDLTNGIDSTGYPSQPGAYVISWVDANFGTGAEAKFILTANPSTATVTSHTGDGNPEATNATTLSGGVRSTLPGNRVVITYANVNYLSVPNAAGYNMNLTVACNSTVKEWGVGNTISGFIVVGPGDTVAAVLANPFAIAQSMKAALMAPNGNGPACLRAMNTSPGGTYGNIINYTDNANQLPTQASFGASRGRRFNTIALSGVRRYSTDPTNPIVSWSSTKLYIQKLGVDGTDMTLGPYLDFTVRDASQHGTLDNGQYLNPFPNQGSTCAIEFITTSAHGLRTGDQVIFPGGSSTAGYFAFPITPGTSSTALPACSVTFGSANITFATSVTVLANTTESIVFGSDSTSSAYNLVNSTGSPITSTTWTMASKYLGTTAGASACHFEGSSTAALPACSVTFGSPNITFASSVTVPMKTTQGIIFGSDATGNAYTINNATGSPITSTTWAMSINYQGTTDPASTCNMSPICDISNITVDVFVTGSTTFACECGANFFGATVPTQGPLQKLAYTAGTIPLSISVNTPTVGARAPFSFYVAMAAQVNCMEVQLPLQIYMSTACLNSIADEWALVAPSGFRFAVELCDEVWNSSFPAIGPVQRFGNLLGYVPNGSFNSVYAPATAIGVGLYSAYPIIHLDMCNTLQARLDTYGRGYKVVRCIGGFYVNGGSLSQAVAFCNANGVTFDRGMIAPYLQCPSSNNVTWLAACSAAQGNLLAAKMLDVTRYTCKYSSGNWAGFASNAAALTTANWSPKPALTCYESALQFIGAGISIPLTYDGWYHPEFLNAFNAAYQCMQDGSPLVPGSGCAIANHYTHGSMRGNGADLINLWSIQIMAGQQPGDGSTNLFTTTQATGATGNNVSNDITNKSVALQAFLNWIGASNSPPSDPTISLRVSLSRIRPGIVSPAAALLQVTGVGTSFTSGSAVSVQNSVTGTTYVTAGTWTAITATLATLSVTTGPGAGPGTGTWTLTVDGVTSQTLAIGPRRGGWFGSMSRLGRLSRVG